MTVMQSPKDEGKSLEQLMAKGHNELSLSRFFALIEYFFFIIIFPLHNMKTIYLTK